MSHRELLRSPDDYWADGELVPLAMMQHFDRLSRKSCIAQLHATIESMDSDIRIAERHGLRVDMTRRMRTKCFELLAELVNP
jgi:hypothetical protein